MPRPDRPKKLEVFQPDSPAVRGMIEKRKKRHVFRPPRGVGKTKPGKHTQALEATRCAQSKCQRELVELSLVYRTHDGTIYCRDCGQDIEKGAAEHEAEAAEATARAAKRKATDADRKSKAKRTTADA